MYELLERSVAMWMTSVGPCASVWSASVCVWGCVVEVVEVEVEVELEIELETEIWHGERLIVTVCVVRGSWGCESGKRGGGLAV